MTILYTRPARYVYGIAICFALAGCATAPQIEYRTVPVPIPVPCATALPPEPKYPVMNKSDDIYVAASKRRAGEQMRDAYIIELKAAQAGCKGASE